MERGLKHGVSGQPGLSCCPLIERAPLSVRQCRLCRSRTLLVSQRRYIISRAQQPAKTDKSEQEDVDETTLKWGLEAGLWKALTAKNDSGVSKGEQAKGLLKRYGGAYLLTSISFAVVSFAACYALVSAGVDVRSLLSKVGLQPGETGERVGTFAIAYAAHKALSPVRFPPTVALTPVVAKWIGKSPAPVDNSGDSPAS